MVLDMHGGHRQPQLQPQRRQQLPNTARRRRGVGNNHEGSSTNQVTVYVAAFVALTLCQVVGLLGLAVLSSYYYDPSLSRSNAFPGWPVHPQDTPDAVAHRQNKHKRRHKTAADHAPAPHLVDDQMEEIEKSLLEKASSDESLARQVIQTLLDASLHDTTQPALDDYYRRTAHSNDTTAELPILVMGGSDGSGTRAFTDIVRTILGVPMLVDDEGTLDVHGTALFAHRNRGNDRGWPPLVQLVLSQTHAANYNISVDLPTPVRVKALAQLDKLQRSWAPRIADLLHSGRENVANHSTTAIAYGFKAPVTLVLLPLLLKAFRGGIKFVHVVRDGRDVAFSRNRSPVTKFFDTMYPPPGVVSLEQQHHYSSAHWLHIQAIRLWNDWNTQALTWARRQSRRSAAAAAAERFDYLVVRAEDLLHGQTRYETYMRLAHFVGSSANASQICHASCRGLVDLGQSGVGNGKRQRYKRRNENGRRTVTDYVDEADDISLEAVALESEQYALDTAVRHLRPNVYAHLQTVRQEQTARRRTQQQQQQQHADQKILQTTKQHNDANFPILQAEHAGTGANGGVPDGDGQHRRNPPRRRLEDTGLITHDSNGNQNRTTIGQRYGKWKAVLQSDRVLSAYLHKEGKEGLEAFGYEPPRRFADLPPGGLPPCTCN